MREFMRTQLYVIFSTVLLISLMAIQNVQANETDYKDLQTTTYQFLQYVKEGHDEAAVSALEEIKLDSMDHSVLPKQIGQEEWLALMEETKRAIEDEQESPEEKYHRALTVVLLYDAIWSKEDSLWVTWKSHLVEKMESSTNDPISLQALSQYYTLYERLLPAFKVSLRDEEYQKMKKHQASFLSFLSGERKQGQETFIQTLSKDLKTIPQKAEEEKRSFTEEPGFIWSIISVGGLIISTLIYVGWRKYRGESENKSEEKEHGS